MPALARLIAVLASSLLSAAALVQPLSVLAQEPATGNFEIPARSVDTFEMTGNMSSVMSVQGEQLPRILSGEWALNATGGNISSFAVNLTEVSVDGRDRHDHGMGNFRLNVVMPIIVDKGGTTFTGMADWTTGGDITWHNVQTTVTISKLNAIRISLDRDITEGHFGGEPIYGVVDSLKAEPVSAGSLPVPTMQQKFVE